MTGNFSPITPVDANIKSLILIVSEIPTSLLDSLNVRVFAKFFAIASIESYPCFPVNVFAFLVFTNKAFTIFLLDFSFQDIVSETMEFEVVSVA